MVIPGSVTNIGNYAFQYTYSGKTNSRLVLNYGIETIGRNAFYSTDFTGDLIIPDSVTELKSSAFQLCNNFNGNLKLSNSLTKIESYTFSECDNLSRTARDIHCKRAFILPRM